MEDLELPKTKLFLFGNVLKKSGKNGTTIATFALADINDIRCKKTSEYALPVMLIAVFASLAIVSKTYIPWPGLDWTAAIICGAIALFAIVLICGRKIVLDTDEGTVAYLVSDTFEEAEGFVLSVRQRLKSSPQSSTMSEQ